MAVVYSTNIGSEWHLKISVTLNMLYNKAPSSPQLLCKFFQVQMARGVGFEFQLCHTSEEILLDPLSLRGTLA